MGTGRLAGKVAIVTGAGTGIGRGIAIRFAQEGASLALVGRRREPLTETGAACVADKAEEGESGRVLVVDGDIASEHDCEKIVERTTTGFGHVDILVNNAGIYAGKPLLDTDLATWEAQVRVNLTGTFLMTRAALPALIESQGAIVNIASTCGIRPIAATPAYGAAKAGMVHLTQTTAFDYAARGVRVNCIAPGVVDTPIHGVSTPEEKAEFEQAMGEMHPLGRVGTPGDVAAAAVFLASDEAAWITGAVLPVDGGIALT